VSRDGWEPDWATLYPSLERFSGDVGLPADRLVRSYLIERAFHHAILAEPSFERRRAMYDEVYTRVFEIYGFTFTIDKDATTTPKDATVEMLRPELAGRSILDVGCGTGQFLLSCAAKVRPRRLVGLDVFAADMEVPEKKLSFMRRDVIRFDLPERFEVAVTDNVMEHIAPQDVPDHLASIHRALEEGGTLVVFTPHRYFGPWDVTRIRDDNYAGWIEAEGTHLKEYTYAELAAALTEAGFTDLRTIHPRARLGQRPAHARMPLDVLLRGERKPRLVRRLQAMDKRFRYPAFEIAIIARKAPAA
jgi:SAM-dependent methyltransferase